MLKTKVNIALAYLSLVERYSVLNISNDAIIQKAEVSRGTFYNNFSKQQDILDYIQVHIEEELIIPIQNRLATFPNEEMNPDSAILVISEVLIPMLHRRTNLFGILYRCQLDRLWTTPLLKVFNRFINPSMNKEIENDSKVAIGYMLLILESWISTPEPIPPAEFKTKFCQLVQQPAIGLLEKD